MLFHAATNRSEKAPVHWVIPDPDRAEARLTGLLELNLPERWTRPTWMSPESANLPLQVGSALALLRSSLRRHAEHQVDETIEAPTVRAAVAPDLALDAALRLTRLPLGVQPLR
jgi:hypothetical protein